MRHIEVEYQDGSHVFVDDYLLGNLIRSGEIRQFYRPSEKSWVTIGVDPVRQETRSYAGRERRRAGSIRAMTPQPASAL